MSVRFIIGRSGTGKTWTCLNEIKEELAANPLGENIIYLVPDQMTFLSEYELVTSGKISGMIRAQVYSFSRLAWRILQETGGANRYHLSSVGLNMLIRKIITEQKDKFKIFQLASSKSGFTNEVEQLLTEFRRYCLQPAELLVDLNKEAAEGNFNKRNLQNKLADLQMIYEHFQEQLSNKYIDGEDYLNLLTSKIASSETLKGAHIYIDGFYSFTPQEYAVIEQLMKHCGRVTIALTADYRDDNSQIDELDQFRMTIETMQSLKEIANNANVKIEETVKLEEQHRFQSESLKHLEAYFESRPAHKFTYSPDVELIEAANRRVEIEGIAREINEQTRENDYRYRDIAILVRNSEDYEELIESTFTDYNIPHFIDKKKAMLNHPLIELIRSSLETIANNWPYESVFRAVKTELLFPLEEKREKYRENMDKLENYCLAYGIQGRKWTSNERWQYRRIRSLEQVSNIQTDKEKEFEDELNEWKSHISEPLMRLSRGLKKAESGRELCEALFLYLEELQVKDKLEKLQYEAEEQGQLLKSSEHDQAWSRTIELLDQFVEILGDEKVSLKKFINILDAGIETLTFSSVPPSLDQVVVADLENSRLGNIKLAFVIGLNEGVLPLKLSDDGLLADEERIILSNSGIELAPTSEIRLLDEDFVAYKTFTLASHKLFVSYPIANEDGKSLIPSFYIKRLADIFPNIKKRSFVTDIASLTDEEQLTYIYNKRASLSYTLTQLERFKRNYPISDLWWDAYNYYVKNEQWKARAEKMFSSLFYRNYSKKLSDETTRSLYSEQILASVSRMEMYYRCPFSHFAQHGLKLRDRELFRLEAPHIGELFHSALKHISDTVSERDLSWNDLTKSDCSRLAADAVNEIAPHLQNEILYSSNRHFYMKRKLEQVISRASYILSEHARRSGFSPVGLEVGFGRNEQLPALQLPLKNNFKMELRGRIDRVDQGIIDNKNYLRIVDYKSSSHDLNLTEIYYGLSLQMLTYLDIVVENASKLIGSEAFPAGLLYFHVHNPVITAKTMLSSDEIEGEILKKFKMKGLLLAEENVIKHMDYDLESGSSEIISAGFRKDGTFTKNSKIATKNQFETMINYVRGLYVKAGNEIVSGNTEIAPFKLGNRSACTFCSFKSICQFDESSETNQYRQLRPRNNDELLQLIAKEVNEVE